MDKYIKGQFDQAARRHGGGNSPKNDKLAELRQEKQAKYDEIEQLRSNIAALKAEIDQKNGILRTMTGRRMEAAYNSLDAEIAGLVREKQSEQQAIDGLRQDIETIKQNIAYVQREW